MQQIQAKILYQHYWLWELMKLTIFINIYLIKKMLISVYHIKCIGDVYLTCTSVKSRNFTLGIQIYENGVDKALENSGSTVEGYHTAKTLEKMIKEKEINNIPFLKSILDVLFNSKKPVNLLDFMNEL
ncbi:hypothetical protein ONA02_04060 [Mycoplasmopsis felis]|nr:NAD(P)H-dependent glycerol-3-phosphate dehydrogenase [Mycoplasmopsis felis]WAM01823.1 hypothetical protein ONA02_04060 [Mycoplasmopsis felis]